MYNEAGRVRNILVTNYNEFEEHLVRLLIKFGISYVKLGNEFHFLDRIYRFFDIKRDRDVILTRDEFIEKDCIISSSMDLIFLRDKESFENHFRKYEEDFSVVVSNEVYDFDEVEYKPKKQQIKRENKLVNQKLKKKFIFNRPVNCRRGK